MMIQGLLKDYYVEEKKKKKKKKKKRKNCQAHVTVLRTCSMSRGHVYKAIYIVWIIDTMWIRLLVASTI